MRRSFVLLALALHLALTAPAASAGEAKNAQNVPQTATPPQTEQKPCWAIASQPYWKRSLKPDILPVWIGGLAALLAGIAGLVGLRFLREQNKVNLATAKAALVSAKAFINAERAWLLITVEPRGNDLVIVGTNKGRTPAEIISEYPAKIVHTQRWAHLSDIPAYEPLRTVPQTITLLGNEPADITSVSVSMMSQGMDIYVFGCVFYRDTLDPDKPLHETAWCFQCVQDTSLLKMIRRGPAAYNRHT